MSERPNLYWRDTVRCGFSRFEATSPDLQGDFLKYIERHYAQEKEASCPSRFGSPVSTGENLSLYTLSVALLTYGRIDVIGDVLDNLPAAGHPARILARAVDALIPLAPDLDSLENPQATLAWINKHKSLLRWQPAEGRFDLDRSM